MQSHLVKMSFLRGKQFLQHTPPAIRLPPIWINPSDLPCDLACDLPCDLTCQCWQGTSASEHLFRKDSHVDDLYCAQCKGPILVDCQQTRELQLSYSSISTCSCHQLMTHQPNASWKISNRLGYSHNRNRQATALHARASQLRIFMRRNSTWTRSRASMQ